MVLELADQGLVPALVVVFTLHVVATPLGKPNTVMGEALPLAVPLPHCAV
jgi:hypothetical protein